MKKIFSTTIIISTLLYAVWFFMPFGWSHLYDDEILRSFEWGGYGAVLNPEGFIPYVIGSSYLISVLCMLLYKSWARTLFLFTVIVDTFTTPFWGVVVFGHYDSLLSQIITLADGAIISMAYLTSINNEFQKNA